jgi:mRNA interferase RelE/StbE
VRTTSGRGNLRHGPLINSPGLDHHVQDRIVSKLDEVVTSEWREPSDYLEPLTGGPFEKLRVGQYRLACVLDHQTQILEVHRIEHRSGAYTADD